MKEVTGENDFVGRKTALLSSADSKIAKSGRRDGHVRVP